MTEHTESAATPAVSISMPVYNGEKYIREALDSVLAQTFGDFELLISDNGSTDMTGEICTEYGNRDPRIRYIRQTQNHGGHWNFNFVTQNARGNLITWLAHDDILEPDFLEATVQYMLENPDTVLVASDFAVIDQDGKGLELQELEKIRDHVDWEKRCAEFFKYPISNVFFCIYGLMRTEACKSVLQSVAEPRMANGSELPILARLAARGEISSIPVISRKYRIHADSVYSAEVAATSTRPLFRRVLMDIANVNRLRLDQMAVLFSSPYPAGFKFRTLNKMLYCYLAYFFSRTLKIPMKLAGILKSRFTLVY